MLRLLKMLVLPLVAGSMIAGEDCCQKLLKCLKAAIELCMACPSSGRKPVHQA